MIKTIAILGATGSIGRQTVDILRQYPDRFRARVLTAGSGAAALFALAREFQPDAAALSVEPESIPDDLKHIAWFFGDDASARAIAAFPCDDALVAVVGLSGLAPSLAALGSCSRLLLANKESLVAGGALVTEKARALGRPILPVDSEHSAIYQCLRAREGNEVSRLILTASGGPFRQWSAERIAKASVAEALGHPTWRMGRKLTVDCASLMNKGLEVLEARWLFDMPLNKIDVTVHPQSVVHSMVEFVDGAVLAQLGAPDMRGPISYALGYPERLPYGGARLDFAGGMALSFEAPDLERFPCLRLARESELAGGTHPAALNAANEEAVNAFLAGRLAFGGIPRVVERVLARRAWEQAEGLEALLEADNAARADAREIIKEVGI